jgi:hypothetical protein
MSLSARKVLASSRAWPQSESLPNVLCSPVPSKVEMEHAALACMLWGCLGKEGSLRKVGGNLRLASAERGSPDLGEDTLHPPHRKFFMAQHNVAKANCQHSFHTQKSRLRARHSLHPKQYRQPLPGSRNFARSSMFWWSCRTVSGTKKARKKTF